MPKLATLLGGKANTSEGARQQTPEAFDAVIRRVTLRAGGTVTAPEIVKEPEETDG